MSRVGRDLYEKFFRNYTRKQWGLDPSELDASVTARVPVRTTRDNRYFTDRFQAMPLHGYTRMFEKILDHPNIKVMLNTGYADIKDEVRFRHLNLYGSGGMSTLIIAMEGCLIARFTSSTKHMTKPGIKKQPLSTIPTSILTLE